MPEIHGGLLGTGQKQPEGPCLSCMMMLIES